jgi:hypothetical protein
MASMIRSIRRNNEARIAKEKWGLSRSKYFKEKRKQLIEQYRIMLNKKSKKRDIKQAKQRVKQIKQGNIK